MNQSKPKIYEIINPHDKATFEAVDDEVAALAMILLGEGAYGCTDEAGVQVCGLALFGGFPANIGALTHDNVVERSHARTEDIAAALESLIYCSLSDRAAVLAAGGDLRKFNEAKRSSMTNMSKRARSIAAALSKGKKPPAGEPWVTTPLIVVDR